MVQEAAIWPVSDELPDMPSPYGFIRKAESSETGSDAGVHRENVREIRRAANEGTPFAFYKGCNYVYRRFAGDIVDARVGARVWGMVNGYQFDGELTESGLQAAMRAV